MLDRSIHAGEQSIAKYWPVCLFFAVAALVMMVDRWGGTVADSHYYHQVAQYLRGELPQESLRAPFAYRVLAPAIAAALPGDVRGTFVLTNWFSVTAAATVIYLTHLKLGFSERAAILAGCFLIFSVPTYWYAPYLTVDPLSVLLRALVVYLVLGGATIGAAVVGLLAVVTREDNLIILAGLAVWTTVRATAVPRISRSKGLWPMVSIAGACALIAIRWHFDRIPSYFWWPSLAAIQENVHDPSTRLSLVAGAGAVIPFAIVGMLKFVRQPDWIPELRLMGWLLCVAAAAPIYAYLCVRVEGRAVWSLYPFLIPFAIAALADPVKGGTVERVQAK